MKQNSLKKTVGLAAVIFLLPTLAIAYGGPGKGRGQYGPPQTAIDACDGKNTGDTVEFMNRLNVSVSGTCRELDGLLIAMPEGGPGGKGYGRPGCGYGEKEWQGRDREYRHEMRAELLGLTEEQQDEIEAIRTAEIAAHEDLRKKMFEYREQMRELTNKGTFDEDAVRALAEEKAKIQVEMAVARAEMRSRIHAVMTPEQQELTKNYSSERHYRWGRHHRSPGGGWQPDFE